MSAVRARFMNGEIILTAQSPVGRAALQGMYDEGHLHFVAGAWSKIRGELLLRPSVIRWRRPLRGLGAEPIKRRKKPEAP